MYKPPIIGKTMKDKKKVAVQRVNGDSSRSKEE